MRALAFALICLVATCGRAQVMFSPSEMAYLRDQFLESIGGTVRGTVIIPGTLSPAALSAPVPAALLSEADPAAMPVATQALIEARSAQASADRAQGSAASVSNSNAAVSGRLTVLEGRAPIWNQAVTDVASWNTSFWRTTTSTFFTGIITNMAPGGSTNLTHYLHGLVVSNQVVPL